MSFYGLCLGVSTLSFFNLISFLVLRWNWGQVPQRSVSVLFVSVYFMYTVSLCLFNMVRKIKISTKPNDTSLSLSLSLSLFFSLCLSLLSPPPPFASITTVCKACNACQKKYSFWSKMDADLNSGGQTPLVGFLQSCLWRLQSLIRVHFSPLAPFSGDCW